MLTGFLVAAILVGTLTCPLMMWLGRRGVGPGCAIMGRTPRRTEEQLENLRVRHQELSRRLAALQVDDVEQAATLERSRAER